MADYVNLSRDYQRFWKDSMFLTADWQIEQMPSFIEFRRNYGTESITFLLGEVNARPNRPAILMLEKVTGVNPVPEGLRSDVKESAKLWVTWGITNAGRYSNAAD